MKRRLSFRARIALLSATISGLVLALFALGCFALVRSADLGSVDRDLLRMAQPQVDRRLPDEHWQRMQAAISMLGGPEQDLAMMVVDRNARPIVQSPNWPRQFSASQLPLPSSVGLRRRPPMPMQPPPPPLDGGPPPLDGGPPPPDDEVGGPGGPGAVIDTRPPETETRHADGHAYRLAVVGNADVTLAVALRLDHFEAGQHQLALGLLLGWLGALLGIGAGGWVVAEQAMRPVHKISATAERITASRLDARINPSGMGEEFLGLTNLLNQMLERLQRSFEQANRFSADAAHELRTPLTILQGELGVAIQAAPDGSELQESLTGMLDEVHRLAGLVRKLLLLAEADAGELQIDRRRVDLAELVRDAAEDAAMLAPHLKVAAQIEVSAVVLGDRDLIGQVISNLVTNAVRYNRPDGRVALRLSTHEQTARVVVINTGPGIAPEQQGRVFERFFRADPSRTRAAGGVGLGMSLAREIARAHGGDLAIADGRADRTAFALTLPLAPPGS
ncbi:MAG: hypothetical protein HZB16_05585 [Armatimonadetes bacterium]|nr:hypothetical protein [Armatimonadota bacterium]